MARKPRGNRVTVNMKGVEGRILVPEGDYLVSVAEVTVEKGSAADYIKWKCEIADGDYEGKALFYNTSLAPQALWNLRTWLEALGSEVPDDEMDLDLDDLVGEQLVVTVEHESYEGKRQAKIVDCQSANGAAKTEDEDDEDDEKPRKKKSKEVEDDGDEAPRKSRKSRRAEVDEDDEDDEKPRKKSRQADVEEAEEDGEEVEETEESDLTEDSLNDMGEDELADVVAEHKLKIDLDDYETLRRKRRAVVAALKKKGVIA
jgi:hypothetical protein